MNNYIVSARKYRPATFASVVGQAALTATLKNAIATDRLAQAYLFCGSRGVGKTSCARIFAKTINCTHRTPDGEACNECDSCRSFNENRSLNIIELDAASNNGVDSMKELIKQVLVPPTQGRYRVFIIDEVHMLSNAAFNAFLKTLEEPPAYCVFILATTEKHKIIPTILSRCQIFDFNRITVADMIAHLQYVAENEGIAAEPAALNIIARQADGAMRDALSIFDQVAASSRRNITYQSTIDSLNVLDQAQYGRLVEAFLAGDVPTALLIYKEIRDKGFDSLFFINGLGQYMRDLMVASNPATLALLEAGDDVRADMAARAARCTPDFLYHAMSLCNDADLNFRIATNKQFFVELTLIKLCQRQSPSPGNSGEGVGQLQPLATSQSPATPPTTTQSPAPQPQTSATQTTPVQTAPAQQPAAQHTTLNTQNSQHPAPPIQNSKPRIQHSIRPPRISISNLNAAAPNSPQPQATHTDADAPAAARTRPYTDDDLTRAWADFIADNPTEKILIGTMKTAGPTRIADDNFVVEVPTSIQANTLTEAMPRLLDHLHTALANDNITITVRERVGKPGPDTWNEREILEHVAKKSPSFVNFAEKMKLTTL